MHPIVEPPQEVLDEWARNRELRNPFTCTVEWKIGNTWYIVDTECDGTELLTSKVKRLIFRTGRQDKPWQQQKVTILYCRLSNEDALDGESNSIQNQRNLLTKYAHDHGYTNLNVLVDDGYTGTNFDRPGVQEGFELVKQGLVGCWIVKDLSRFGRDYLTVGRYTDIVFPAMMCGSLP